MKTLLALIASLFSLAVGSNASAQVNYERLPGSIWDVASGDRILGTLTFKDATTAATSWAGETTWTKSPAGVAIFGVDLVYESASFSGINSSGQVITMVLQSTGAAASVPMPTATPAPASDVSEVRFDKLETVKLARGTDHAYRISGQKTAFGKSTNRTWETSWGSYIEEYERSATYLFKISHFGSQGTGCFEILFLGKTAEGDQYPYAFESRKMSVTGDTSMEFDVFHKSSDSMFRALNIRIKAGSKPDSWVAWMRNGDTLMGLTAGRGGLADRFEGNPAELIALAKQVIKD